MLPHKSSGIQQLGRADLYILDPDLIIGLSDVYAINAADLTGESTSCN